MKASSTNSKAPELKSIQTDKSNETEIVYVLSYSKANPYTSSYDVPTWTAVERKKVCK
jgi:hypothetical protein